jgi:U3 small nucleolar RNA-associated protein 22
MKRKRGPAPNGRDGREKSNKKRQVEENDQSDDADEFQDTGSVEDTGSFEGFSGDEEQGEEPATQVTIANGDSGTTKKRGNKPVPTQEELTEMFFRSSSFQSNLFKLQVDELLSEVRVKYDKMEKAEQVLHKLKGILTQLPESQEQLVSPMWPG